MDRKGRVKIMDFGLAQIQRAPGLRDKGTTAGTLAYMSPEQAQGQNVDHRTDIFSAGVVLYELLTGRLPFRGEHASSEAYGITHEDPAPLAFYRSDVSEELQRIISRALAKNRHERYQRAEDLLSDLRAERTRAEAASEPAQQMPGRRGSGYERRRRASILGLAAFGMVALAVLFTLLRQPASEGASPLDQNLNQRSLAVLPFTNLGGSREDEYFSDGIMEEVLTQVSKIKGLRVVSRTTVMRYKGSSKSLRQIAEELGVGSILEGSVRRSGQRIRVVSQLVDTRTDGHLWAETYDRELKDVFAIQTDLAEKIAAALRIRLTESEEHELRRLPTRDLDAYKLFLQARYHWRLRTREGLRQAAEYFHRCTELDSTFALAYIGLADCYSLYPFYEIPVPSKADAFGRAEEYARKALDLDPGLAEAHASLGNVLKESKWDWRGAEEEFRRAIALNERYATAHQWYSECLRTQGRMAEAIAEGQRAFELEPYSPIIGNIYGAAILYSGDHDASIPVFKEVLAIDPDAPFARLNLAWAYRFKGMRAEARSHFQLAGVPAAMIRIFTASPTAAGSEVSPDAYRREGLTAKEREFWIMGLALHGDTKGALGLLRGLVAERWPNAQFLIRHPALEPLRSEPRFHEILRSMGLGS